MDRINKVISNIKPLDQDKIDNAQKHLDFLTKPQGSLGKLEEIAKQVVAIVNKDKPNVDKKVIFTLAGDHGVVDEGVSAFPQSVTHQMVHNFLNGGAAINVLARQAGADVIVADLGVKGDLEIKDSHGFKCKKVNHGTNNFVSDKAMSKEDAIQSILRGIELVDEAVKNGADIVGIGEMGIGNTTPSSAITSVITGVSVEDVTGRGTGVDDSGLKNKIEVVSKAIDNHNPDKNCAIDVLSAVGGYEIGGMAGIIIGAAANGVPVVLDGFISGAAALLAYTLCNDSKYYMIPSHCSVEVGHMAIYKHIGLTPMFDFGLRLGEGTGAALAMNMVEASMRIYNEMATFASAGVSESID